MMKIATSLSLRDRICVTSLGKYGMPERAEGVTGGGPTEGGI